MHGHLIGEPRLDLDRLAEIAAAVSVPLVIHGGSGLADEEYRGLIERGVAKINYFTALSDVAAAAASDALASLKSGYLRSVDAVRLAVSAEVTRTLRLFGASGRAAGAGKRAARPTIRNGVKAGRPDPVRWRRSSPGSRGAAAQSKEIMTSRIARMLIAAAAAQWLGGAIAQERHDHHNFAPDVDAFHAVLAPLWHARPGEQRSRRACSQASRLDALARDIRAADAAALQASVAALMDKCQGKPAEVDGALHDVHEAFHRLIEPGPAK